MLPISPFAHSVAVFFSLYYLINDIKKEAYFWTAVAVGMVGCSYLGRLHSGGSINVLIPSHAVIAILFGFSLNSLLEYCKAIPNEKFHKAAKYAIYILCIIQYSMLLYDPFEQIPKLKDRVAVNQLVTKISGIEGEVYFPSYSYLSVLAGKRGYAHVAAVHDILRTELKEKQILENEISNAIRNQYFGAIIVNKRWFAVRFNDDLNKYYVNCGNVLSDSETFCFGNGPHPCNSWIYFPKSTILEEQKTSSKTNTN